MILILNCGSQSIKWKLFNQNLKPEKEGHISVSDEKDYERFLISELKKIGEAKIDLIGHRVVHGGNKFVKPMKITDENLAELEKFNHLAPLHNPFNILGIKACQNIFKNVPQIAVFDTEFFKDLPERAFTYALPEEIVKEFGLRRYGFHGISHEYAANEAAKIMAKPIKDLKIISCHLGGGSSITAIDRGRAVDTSMGFTPLEGAVMMTRSGNVDPGILTTLQNKVKNLDYILNNESGMKGLCGLSDMKEVLAAIKKGSKKAKMALDIYVYSIQKYIGSYFAILGGCDLLVFTGAIGSGSAKIRNMICKNLKISSKTKILAIEADEELAIAKKVFSI